MFGLKNACVLNVEEEYRTLEDYQGRVVRWCPGCGDHGILTATQKVCRDEQLPREKTVFVSGIGCASRFPHYMGTYGFHGLHGRALVIAQGMKIRRPDLHVFVNTGDGDCCSIGTAHWIHTIRLNIDITCTMHDNQIYGLTKKQVSPTTPEGWKTSTTPYGSKLHPLNPLTATLGVTNVSFVAQVVEWIPEVLYDVLRMAFRHRGFSFVRVLQRCPHFMPDIYSKLMTDPNNIMLLSHEDGLQISEGISRLYKTQEEHDPMDLQRAREIAALQDKVPIGILYRNPSVPTYDDLRAPDRAPTVEQREDMLNSAFDKFGIFPNTNLEVVSGGNGDGTGKE
jgi:2-oxoglutarate ferredoxin oxidoreductase subunit beta